MDKPIRILQVVTYMGRGGLETMLMNYYRNIDRTKVQFDFLTHREFRADYDEEIEELGGRIYRLPRLIPWSKSYLQTLDSFFSDHPEYKIIHVHQDCLSSVILKSAQKQGIPVRIAHSHSSSQDKNLKYLIKLWYKRTIPRYATGLFACGQKAGDWMFGGAPYAILNNAINARAYSFCSERQSSVRQQLNIPPDAFVVGHVGRFSYPKNHEFLLDIFDAVYAQDRRAFLLLVGDGELRVKMERKAATLGLTDRVLFTGLRSDVPQLLQAMDVFVFPSHYEGLPVTLVEAQAAGLPCMISEQIPAECSITDLVIRISLEKTPGVWAERVLAVRKDQRRNTYAQVVSAGYDIIENASRLQNYYIEQWKASK